MKGPEITRYLESRFRTYSEADLAAYVSSMRADPIRFLAVVRHDDGRHIGNVSSAPSTVTADGRTSGS